MFSILNYKEKQSFQVLNELPVSDTLMTVDGGAFPSLSKLHQSSSIEILGPHPYREIEKEGCSGSKNSLVQS